MSQFLGETQVLTTSVIATADIAENQLVGFDGAPAGNDGLVYGKARAEAGRQCGGRLRPLRQGRRRTR